MGKKTTVEVLVEGGKASAGAALGGTLGPLKVNIGQVVTKLNEKTKDFQGMKVPAKVIVDIETKEFEITIGTPPAADLIKKEIGIQKGSGEPNKNKAGVISIEQAIKVAKMKSSSLIVNDLKSALKTIIGTCQAAGILVDGKEPREILKEIDEGKYDIIIKAEKTEPDKEKKEMLNALAKELKTKMETLAKEKTEAKAAAEAEAASKAAKAPAPVEAKPVAAKAPAKKQ